MKKFALFLSVFALIAVAFPVVKAEAATSYYYVPSIYGYNQASVITPTYGSYGSQMSQDDFIKYLQQLIIQMQLQLAAQKGSYNYGYGYDNNYDHKYTYIVGSPRGHSDRDDDDDYDDDEPEVDTTSVSSIEEDEAVLEGEVEMNDFEDGEVFFVYGEDEDQIEDVEDEFDSYSDVDEDGDDLQKVLVDSGLDDDEEYEERITGLDENTDYYFQICVGFEDEDDDDVIICGGVIHFETD